MDKIQKQASEYDAYQEFINSDLSITSNPVINPNRICIENFILEESIIVQIHEAVNISISMIEKLESRNEGKNGTFKFLMSDGYNNIIGVSKDQIINLPTHVVPGTKMIIYRNTKAKFGVFLLKNENIKIIGGKSEKLCREEKEILIFDPLRYQDEKLQKINQQSIDKNIKFDKNRKETIKINKNPKLNLTLNSQENENKNNLSFLDDSFNSDDLMFLDENENTQAFNKSNDEHIGSQGLEEVKMIRQTNFLSDYDDDLLVDEYNNNCEFEKEKIDIHIYSITELMNLPLPKNFSAYPKIIYLNGVIINCGELMVIKKGGNLLFSMDCLVSSDILSTINKYKIKVAAKTIEAFCQISPEAWIDLDQEKQSKYYKNCTKLIMELKSPLYIIDSGKLKNRFLLCHKLLVEHFFF